MFEWCSDSPMEASKNRMLIKGLNLAPRADTTCPSPLPTPCRALSAIAPQPSSCAAARLCSWSAQNCSFSFVQLVGAELWRSTSSHTQLSTGSVRVSLGGMEQSRERISARERAKTKKREEKRKQKEGKKKQKKGKRWAWSTERAAAEFESSLVAPARLLLAQEHVGRDEFRDPRHFHLVTWGATHIFR